MANPRVWLWALPRGETDRLHERPLTSMALTAEQAERVERAASADGWHGFRRVVDDHDVPDFGAAVQVSHNDTLARKSGR